MERRRWGGSGRCYRHSVASEILIEHGETRLARRLRSNRYKVALAIAALEGILALAGAIPWWIVVLLALVSLAGYVAWGREHESADVRVVTWTAAASTTPSAAIQANLIRCIALLGRVG